MSQNAGKRKIILIRMLYSFEFMKSSTLEVERAKFGEDVHNKFRHIRNILYIKRASNYNKLSQSLPPFAKRSFTGSRKVIKKVR